MAQWLVFDYPIAISAATLLNFDIACLAQIINDRAGVTLSNSDQGSQVSDLYIGVLGQLQNDVSVIAQEGPVHIEIIAVFCLR